MERREGQGPGGRPRKPVAAGRARLRMGLANPSASARWVPRSQGAPQGRRSAAPWRLPALHSPHPTLPRKRGRVREGGRKTGQGNPRPCLETGGGALASRDRELIDRIELDDRTERRTDERAADDNIDAERFQTDDEPGHGSTSLAP